ncbi:MAG: hypothetical protein GX640_19545, partial [Fibrobacter sp.]|nr:hypothetical protein [Fibrobacter sp.]
TLDTMLINSDQPNYRFRKKYEKGIPHYLFVKNIVTDNKGNHSFNFNTDTLFGNGFHTFYGQVRGDDNRIYQAERELLIATDTPFIEIYPQISPCSTGTSLSLSCFVVEPSGAPVTTEVVCKLLNKRGEPIVCDSSCTVNGVARFLFTISDTDSPSQAQVTVHANSNNPRTVFTEIQDFIPRKDNNDSIHIFTDREKYSHGDTAHITVYWPSNATNQFVVTGNISMKNYQKCNNVRRSEFAIPLTADFGSVFFISFVWFDTIKYDFQTAHKQIIMNPDSSIMLSVNGIQSRTFDPGDLCTLKIAVTDKQRKPVKAAFSAAVVDEAVFAFTPERDTGALYSLTPQSFQYPCSLFTVSEDFATDVRDRIRLIDSLGSKVCFINNKTHKKRKKSILGNYISEFLSDMCSKYNADMWWSMKTGKSIDDLIGGLMGGGGGGLILKKRGSLNIAAPTFMKGSALSGSPVRLRKYFTDQAFWANTIFSDTNGNAEITFRFPDNLSQWRVHLRGSDGNHLLLDYKDSLFTTKKLMIQLETPRFLIENDKSSVRTVVFNNTPDQLPVHVSCNSQKGITLNCKYDVDTIIFPNSTLSLDWPIIAVDSDSATIIAQVLAENFSDAESRTIPVNRYSVTMQTGKSLILKDSSSVAINISPDNMPHDKKLMLQITSDPVFSLMPSLTYLMKYPHGCVEQTMSRFLPNLYVGKLLDTNNRTLDSLRTVFRTFVDKGLQLLSGYQHADGGWGWWVDDTSHPKMTALVVKGLSCALQTPISIEQRNQIENMLKAGIPRLIEFSHSVVSDTILTLSILNGITHKFLTINNSKFVDNLMRNLPVLKTSHLAVLLECTHSLKLYNYDTLLSAELEKRIQKDDGFCWWENDIHPNSQGDWIHSDVYITALVLSVLSLSFPDHHLIQSVLQWLYAQNDGEKWLSTAVTSEVIHSIGNCFAPSVKKYDLPNLINLSVNGLEVTPYLRDKKSTAFSGYEYIEYIVPDSLIQLNNTIKAKLPENKTLFLSASMYYRIHPSYINSEKYPLKISRTIERVDYPIENETQVFPLRNTCTVGDELLVHLQIKTKKQCKYLCLEERFPAGVEVIIPERMAPPKGCIHAEYYPDKCNFYFSDIPAGTTEITYR